MRDQLKASAAELACETDIEKLRGLAVTLRRVEYAEVMDAGHRSHHLSLSLLDRGLAEGFFAVILGYALYGLRKEKAARSESLLTSSATV